MGKLKTLASDTVVYGFSTILSRLIGWLMMPLYVRIVSQPVYGTFSYVYSMIAILLVVVTLGFETGYFRYASDDTRDKLLGTLSQATFGFGFFLLLLCFFFPSACCSLLGFDFGPGSSVYLILMASIVLLDSYNAIFFAELRYLRQSVRYAVLRLVQVLVNVVLTCLFLFVLKEDTVHFGGYFATVSDVTYMMLANLIGSFVATVVFAKRIAQVVGRIDFTLLKSVLLYSLPLVGMGFFGTANTNIEKILIKLLDPSENPLASLGIYAACYKIGVLMSIFTQSFRMAFEPFFFKEHKEKEKTEIYGTALKWFVYFGLIIFAGVMLFMPLIRLVLQPSYYEGIAIIPWILIGQLFFGVYYSLSLWYKLTDKTYWGIILSILGLGINSVMNFVLIPRYGFMGAAYSTFVGYLVMMVTSYLLGQKFYPIDYPVRKLLIVTLMFVGIVMGSYEIIMSLDSALWVLVSVLSFALLLGLLFFSERETLQPALGKIFGRLLGRFKH